MFKYPIIAIALLSVLSGVSLAYTATIYPSDDSEINEGAPNLNTGGHWYASAGKHFNLYRLYGALKFDLSGLTGYTINSATLGVKIWLTFGTYPMNEPNIARVHSDWSEDTITWNNHPPYDAWKFVVDPPPSGQWWYINITKWTKEWVNGSHGNYGVYLKANSIGEDMVWFFTKERYGRLKNPKLVVIFSDRTSVETASLGKIKAAFK
ncbi:MAG: DNRLRE domain-containing protein [bacterium]|nr:DNRLRE domain-containing protein [bacterium]